MEKATTEKKKASAEQGRSEEIKKVFLESGFEVKPVYSFKDEYGTDPVVQEELPGEYPFTREIHPLMYCKRPFTIRQYAGFASPEETNNRFQFLIRTGQTGLNVAFDLSTQCGLDSDDPRAL